MNRDDAQGRSPGLQQQAEPGIRLGDLYQELEQILQRSELLAASGRDDQIHELARHLTALRSLLADLLIVTGEPGRRQQDNAVLEQLVCPVPEHRGQGQGNTQRQGLARQRELKAERGISRAVCGVGEEPGRSSPFFTNSSILPAKTGRCWSDAVMITEIRILL